MPKKCMELVHLEKAQEHMGILNGSWQVVIDEIQAWADLVGECALGQWDYATRLGFEGGKV